LHEGTRLLELVEPVVAHEVGLLWGEGDVMMPMANAFVKVVRGMIKSKELAKRLMPELAGESRERERESADVD